MFHSTWNKFTNYDTFDHQNENIFAKLQILLLPFKP